MADMSQFHVLIIFFTFIKLVPEIEDHLVGLPFWVLGVFVLGRGDFVLCLETHGFLDLVCPSVYRVFNASLTNLLLHVICND